MELDGILKIILIALLAAFFSAFMPRKLKERDKFIDTATKFRESFIE